VLHRQLLDAPDTEEGKEGRRMRGKEGRGWWQSGASGSMRLVEKV
jgi:hypothetical protein